MYTKEMIMEKLSTDRRWVERALVVLHDRQTLDEQQEGTTKFYNGVGFNGTDGRYLSYCAEWVKRGGHLNDKHFEKCSRKLPKYWKQIQSIINSNNPR